MAALSYDPSTHPALSGGESDIVKQIFDFTQKFFENPKFDSSHDFNHVMRVVSNAVHILEHEQNGSEGSSVQPRLSAFVIIMAALLHDVDDRKYVDASSNGIPMAKQELLRLGMNELEAEKIQKLVDGVSYSSEVKNPDRVKTIIREIPELAVVQDADRLDAIGAIGIARCFTFGGAKRARTLERSIEHFLDKLVKLERMMKTETGKALAAERTKRLKEYLKWWEDETSFYPH